MLLHGRRLLLFPAAHQLDGQIEDDLGKDLRVCYFWYSFIDSVTCFQALTTHGMERGLARFIDHQSVRVEVLGRSIVGQFWVASQLPICRAGGVSWVGGGLPLVPQAQPQLGEGRLGKCQSHKQVQRFGFLTWFGRLLGCQVFSYDSLELAMFECCEQPWCGWNNVSRLLSELWPSSSGCDGGAQAFEHSGAVAKDSFRLAVAFRRDLLPLALGPRPEVFAPRAVRTEVTMQDIPPGMPSAAQREEISPAAGLNLLIQTGLQ